jgi:sulfite exporter TauE/SafE
VRGTVAVLAGRLLAYALAGALVGLAVQSLHWLVDATAWLKPIWTMVQVMLVGLGLWLLFNGDLPPSLLQWTERLGRPRASDVALPKVHLPGELKAVGLGLLWPLLPCGLLHAALALAALASTPLEAAQVMAVFALTSSAGLLAGGWMWRWLPSAARTGGAADSRLAVRMAGAGIAGLCLWPLARHAWAPFQAAWCA